MRCTQVAFASAFDDGQRSTRTRSSTWDRPLSSSLRTISSAEPLEGRVGYGRGIETDDPLPLPDDPLLAGYAQALNDAGHWAIVLDSAFRLVFITDELRRSLAGLEGLARVPLGLHYFGSEAMAVRSSWAHLFRGKDSH